MFSRQRKSLHASDISTGQSLFDFLKSKKKGGVDSSFRNSRNLNDSRQQEQEPSLNLDEYEVRQAKTDRKVQANTPKKVTFMESSQARPTARSFVQMISPIKRTGQTQRANSKQNVPERPSSILKSSANKKAYNKSENFSRNTLNQSISTIKQTMQKMMSEGKKIKDRSHTLFLELKPVLKVVEEGSNKNLSRKAQQARQSLRTFEFLLKEFEAQNANEIVEQFHRNLSQHIISSEAKIKSSYQKSEMESINKIKAQKDEEITELSIENQKLNQTIENLTKRLEKMEKNSENKHYAEEEKFQSLKETSTQQIARLEDIINKLQDENHDLKQQLVESQAQKKAAQKALKDAQFAKEKTEERLVDQNCRVKSEKEEFLLNEIMLMKAEFQRDMREVTQLYSSKEKDQGLLINELRSQISELKQERQGQKEQSFRVYSEGESLRGMVNKYKRQNECLVTDMHRMNEELYQHWLALKDIKTLAIRLNSFSKFTRIYEDLPFNDQLFS